jgi:hypothetical protein
MHYLGHSGTYEEIGDAWIRYRKYLTSIRDRLPASVFEFAWATWHYNPTHFHDGKTTLECKSLIHATTARHERLTTMAGLAWNIMC